MAVQGATSPQSAHSVEDNCHPTLKTMTMTMARKEVLAYVIL